MITNSEFLQAARTMREYCGKKHDCFGCPLEDLINCGGPNTPKHWNLPDDSTESEEQQDAVNHPQHYCMGRIETIEAIESALGKDGFRAYCAGNVLKYVWRYRYKGGKESLEKARWYLDRLITEEEGGDGDG